MKLIIKDIRGSTFELNDISEEDTVKSINDQVCEHFSYTHGTRLIYCGRILEQDKLVGDYIKNNFTGFIVCIPNKPTITTENNTPINQPTTSQAPQQASQAAPSRTYTADEVKAVILIYTQFLRTTPEIFHTFCTNGYAFQEFILSPIFSSTLLEPFLSASQDILHAVNTQSSLEISIPTSVGGNTIISNSLINPNNTASIGRVINRPPISVPESSTNTPDNTRPSSPQQTTQSLSQFTSNLTNLTEEDEKNIEELVSLGFPDALARRVYLLSNKNKSLAASLLFDNI